MQSADVCELERLRSAWLTNLEASGLKRGSLSTYKSALTDYFRWIAYNKIRYDQISSQQLDQWKLQLVRVRGIKPATANYYKSGLKSFYEWLEREGYVFNSSVNRMKGMKTPRLLPKPISEADVTKLLEGADTVQLRAMLEVFYGCGLRHEELRMMNVGDVDLSAGVVRVMGKGEKERLAPIAGAAVEAMRLHLAGHPLGARALWLGPRGKRISQKMVRKTLAALASSVGVDGHIHPHRLRHSFATHLLNWGMGIEGIQKLLGHAKISTSMIYTEVALERVQKEYLKIHKRAKPTTESPPPGSADPGPNP